VTRFCPNIKAQNAFSLSPSKPNACLFLSTLQFRRGRNLEVGLQLNLVFAKSSDLMLERLNLETIDLGDYCEYLWCQEGNN